MTGNKKSDDLGEWYILAIGYVDYNRNVIYLISSSSDIWHFHFTYDLLRKLFKCENLYSNCPNVSQSNEVFKISLNVKIKHTRNEMVNGPKKTKFPHQQPAIKSLFISRLHKPIIICSAWSCVAYSSDHEITHRERRTMSVWGQCRAIVSVWVPLCSKEYPTHEYMRCKYRFLFSLLTHSLISYSNECVSVPHSG